MKITDFNFEIRDAQKSDMDSVNEIFNVVLSNSTATIFFASQFHPLLHKNDRLVHHR